jgi:hypothetical protein
VRIASGFFDNMGYDSDTSSGGEQPEELRSDNVVPLVDPGTGASWEESGSPFVQVNRRAWKHIEQHDRTMRNEMAIIIPAKADNDRLLQAISPNYDVLVDRIRRRIDDAERERELQVYLRALRDVWFLLHGPSPRDNMILDEIMGKRRKEGHLFPNVDRTMPVADWDHPMWSESHIEPTCPKDIRDKALRRLSDITEYFQHDKPTLKETTWMKQHALWLYDKIKDTDVHGIGPINARIQAMEECRLHRLSKPEEYYETDSDEESFSDTGLIVQVYEEPKAKTQDTLRPKTRSLSRKESWNIPEVSMGSDKDISDGEAEIPTKRGRRAGCSPSGTA